MAKLCMGCMNPLPEDTTACAVCGFDIATDRNPERALPIATSLQGHYIIGRVMGEFPDHLLYLAYDRQMKEPCFVQEFFPATIARRDTIGGIQPLEGCDKVFEEYADRFRTTMRILARMRELPAVVPVYDIFEENGTVYSVSDYCQGMTLTKKIKLSGGRIPWPEARSIFMSLLGSLTQLSEAGICHLAICPDNILIGSDGKARLRNFSITAAHHSGTDLTPDLKTGYAAPEQYGADEAVTASADVYGLAACIFRTVTGTEPPAGDNRAKNSDDLFMSAEVAEELTQPVCVALFNALQVDARRRTATLVAFRDQLSVTPQVSALVTEAESEIVQVEEAPQEEEEKGENRGLVVMLIISLVLLLIAIGVIVFLVLGGNDKENKDGGSAITDTTQSDTDTPADGEVVDTVVGGNYDTMAQSGIPLNGNMKLEKVGFGCDNEKADGEILWQFPEGGELQKEGSPVYVIVNDLQSGDKVRVPDLKEWKYEHAKVCLEALGFTVSRFEQSSNTTLEKGLVVSVDNAGNLASKHSTVRVWVSNRAATAETALVPSLTGYAVEHAKNTLGLLGFFNVQVMDASNQVVDASNYDKCVVERVGGAGSEQPIDATIILYVGAKETDAPTGTIPNSLIGQSAAYAKGYLEAMGFAVVEVAATNPQYENGMVESFVQGESTVTLYVSRKPFQ